MYIGEILAFKQSGAIIYILFYILHYIELYPAALCHSGYPRHGIPYQPGKTDGSSMRETIRF